LREVEGVEEVEALILKPLNLYTSKPLNRLNYFNPFN
jgi:hypothetical protein